MTLKHILCAAMLPFAGGMAFAQGTVDDYNRAYEVRRLYTSSQVPNINVSPRWIPGTHLMIYRSESLDNGSRYVVVDADRATRRDLMDHKRFSRALEEATGVRMAPDSLRLDGLHANARLDTLRFRLNGHHYAYAVKHSRIIDEGAIPPPPVYPHWMVVDEEKDAPAVPSPDGSKIAYIRDCNVWVADADGSNARALSNDGTLSNYYSSYISWSPDGTKVASNRIRPIEKRYAYYVESSPADSDQPRLHKQEYAKPGDERIFKRPTVFDVATGKAAIPSTELFDSQYEIYGPQWNDDSRAITFEYNERGHKNYRVLEMDAASGKVRPLIEESHPKYVNYTRNYRYDLPDGRRMIWSSERSGHQHLYMVDRDKGDIDHAITSGPWYVREVQHVDPENEVIYFSANGVNAPAGEDPYHIRYYRVNFDGTGLTDLTPVEGHHQAVYSPDFRYLVDIYSTVQNPPVATLRSAVDGSEVMPLEKADISRLLATGWTAPEVFVAPGRDGVTPMWGLIRRPSNFDPSRTYPIIEYIYQGPGDQYVPKSFRPYDWTMTSLSELGFIVVMVDGMSTSFRSRDFENICYKNLKDAALPDHMAWIRAAAEKYPYMDIDRVGIYGCSAGGQESTNAVLLHPDFYKCAYSACGCHDNRMDKIWWNELWMGYPVDESYIECSNVANAHLLERPLMLVVGEMDDNVDPSSTMQVANALIKAGKDFELVVIPGAHHTMGDDFGERKRHDFFVRHLLGVNPPAWKDVNTRP